MKRFIPHVLLITSTVLQAQPFTPDSDGIYAVFNVSYFDPAVQDNVQDEFTVQLFYSETPVTSANFIGLAEGTLEWFDFESYTVRGGLENPEPYFNGLTFHRVVPNFVIQTGSPNGNGTDGPGWTIPDEADAELNHVGGGVLSMANSGANTGGSQFFITMAQFDETQPQLDALNGKHTIFGFVRGDAGIQVTQAINRTPIAGSQPTHDAVINSVTILRVGDAANNWDPSQYWVQPDFRKLQLKITNNLEDTDNNPDTAPVRVLKGAFEQDKDAIYYFQDSNDLTSWQTDQLPRLNNASRTTEVFLSGDLTGDRRQFYRILEAKLPPMVSLEGRQIVIDIDPVEVDEEVITFLPERYTADFYEGFNGAWTLKRSDSDTMEPIGSILRYERHPIGNRIQLFFDNDRFDDLQAYLEFDTDTTGSVYIYYPTGRPEGATATGTFTLNDGIEPRVLQDKNLTNITITIVQTFENGNDPITRVWDIDLWDNFSGEGLEENFEGGWELSRSDNDFIQTGRVIYEWLEFDGKTYLILDFDVGNDMQLLLNLDAGTAQVYNPSFASFDTATFTLGEGSPRPTAIDKEGTKLVLTLDLSGENSDPLASTLDIDLYDNFEGGYEATRTDTDTNQFGSVDEYKWFDENGVIRVDLTLDFFPPMQVYLTFEGLPDENGFGSGTAKVHFPQNGQVLDATFSTSEGNERPVALDKTDTQLVLNFGGNDFDIITVDLLDEESGWHDFTIPDENVKPVGDVRSYEWFERIDGTDLVFIDYDRLPDMQIILSYTDSARTSGEAKILLTDSGSVDTKPFSIGTARERPVSVNKTGTRLVVDLDTTTIDRIEVDFLTGSTGEWFRFFPDSGDPTTGEVTFYEWYGTGTGDQVNIIYDFFLDTQIFLDYSTDTTGTATVYFTTTGNIETGPFTITGSNP